MSQQKTIAFFGASGGVGLAALKNTLAAGHQCIALCRDPMKLKELSSQPNLVIVRGNAHDTTSVTQCLKTQDGKLVDAVISTIGNPRSASKAEEDPNVCEKVATTLLKCLTDLRGTGIFGRPLLVVVSTTGLSRFARDVPVVMLPLYQHMFKVPFKDKRAMEDTMAASGEDFVVVRASALVDGETDKPVRVGIEDPRTGPQTKAIGYYITRENAGKWISENLVLNRNVKYVNKIVSVTF